MVFHRLLGAAVCAGGRVAQPDVARTRREDQHGPKYAPLKKMWADPNPEALAAVAEHVSEDGFRAEFIGEVPDEIADRISARRVHARPPTACLELPLRRDNGLPVDA